MYLIATAALLSEPDCARREQTGSPIHIEVVATVGRLDLGAEASGRDRRAHFAPLGDVNESSLCWRFAPDGGAQKRRKSLRFGGPTIGPDRERSLGTSSRRIQGS